MKLSRTIWSLGAALAALPMALALPTSSPLAQEKKPNIIFIMGTPALGGMARTHPMSAIIMSLPARKEWSSGWEIRLARVWLSSFCWTRSQVSRSMIAG